MADQIVVCLPDGRWLALDRETFEAGLSAGAEFSSSAAPSAAPVTNGSTAPKLMTAEEMETATGVPASWYATQARERRIPFRKLGRYVRFSYDELLTCDAFQRRAIPPGQLSCTGSRDRKGRTSA